MPPDGSLRHAEVTEVVNDPFQVPPQLAQGVCLSGCELAVSLQEPLNGPCAAHGVPAFRRSSRCAIH